MVTIKPFKGLRPRKELASQVASYPYDVINSEEAREIAKDNPLSFLHIVKPEIDLDPGVNIYSDPVYEKAKENFEAFQKKGILQSDPEPYFYIYRQRMGDHEQYGLVASCSVDDYDSDHIKKHEKTRIDKEKDRTRHVLTLSANAGPVFLTYHDEKEIHKMIQIWVRVNPPDQDFTASDGIAHSLWVIHNKEVIDSLVAHFKNIENLYVADGHHRSASASRARKEKQKQNPKHQGDEEYNFFLAVLFPASQLKILAYNRAVKTLNGLSPKIFLEKISTHFEIEESDRQVPVEPKTFCMYLDKKWFLLKTKSSSFDPLDVTDRLDVSILQNHILSPVLGIDDPRTSKEIDFIGGIRGPNELIKLVNAGSHHVAFSLYPCSVDDLMAIADAGEVMPPKSTWFEPKLRSGFVVKKI